MHVPHDEVEACGGFLPDPHGGLPRAAGAPHDWPASKHGQHHRKPSQEGVAENSVTRLLPAGTQDVCSRAPSLPAYHTRH